jgi:hypothetical protein
MATRAELALHDSSRPAQTLQSDRDDRGAEPEAARDLLGVERTMRSCVAGHQIAQRISDRFGENLGHSYWKCRSKCVSKSPGILDGDEAFLAGDADADCPAGGLQLGQINCRGAPGDSFRGRQVTDGAQQVGGGIEAGYAAILGQALQFGLDIGNRRSIEQLTQIGRAHQLGEQAGVQRQRLRPALGQWGIRLVQEHADVPEKQRARER